MFTSFVSAHSAENRNIFNSIQVFMGEQIIKVCSLSRKDAAKTSLKLFLPLLIASKTLVCYGSYRVTSNHCIDYGCEAAWAGYYDGVDAIPAALVKYTCVDACYHQLCACAYALRLDYPTKLKKHTIAFNVIRMIMPFLVKQWIGNLIDLIGTDTTDCNQEPESCL